MHNLQIYDTFDVSGMRNNEWYDREDVLMILSEYYDLFREAAAVIETNVHEANPTALKIYTLLADSHD